jgi:hypothetical protein
MPMMPWIVPSQIKFKLFREEKNSFAPSTNIQRSVELTATGHLHHSDFLCPQQPACFCRQCNVTAPTADRLVGPYASRHAPN